MLVQLVIEGGNIQDARWVDDKSDCVCLEILDYDLIETGDAKRSMIMHADRVTYAEMEQHTAEYEAAIAESLP